MQYPFKSFLWPNVILIFHQVILQPPLYVWIFETKLNTSMVQGIQIITYSSNPYVICSVQILRSINIFEQSV